MLFVAGELIFSCVFQNNLMLDVWKSFAKGKKSPLEWDLNYGRFVHDLEFDNYYNELILNFRYLFTFHSNYDVAFSVGLH